MPPKRNNNTKKPAAQPKKQNKKQQQHQQAQQEAEDALFDDNVSVESGDDEYQDIQQALDNDLFADIAEEDQEEEEKENCLLVVKHLPDNFATKKQLERFFSQISTVNRCEVDPTTKTGYVEFVAEAIVDSIIDNLDFYLLDNSVLRLSKSTVPVEEQETKVWLPVIEKARLFAQETKHLLVGFGHTYGDNENEAHFHNNKRTVQILEHFSAYVPEKSFVVLEQRKRDNSLQQHLRSLNMVYPQELQASIVEQEKQKLKEREAEWTKLGITYSYKK